jgi:hypothetical protein
VREWDGRRDGWVDVVKKGIGKGFWGKDYVIPMSVHVYDEKSILQNKNHQLVLTRVYCHPLL